MKNVRAMLAVGVVVASVAIGVATFMRVMQSETEAEVASDTRPRTAVVVDESLPNSDEGGLVSSSTGDDESTRSWSERFRQSTDYFDFAKVAASAAVEGDARAQYFLSRVLLECEVQTALTTAMERGSLEANIEARFEGLRGMREHHRRKIRREILRCEGFFEGSPFAGLPLPDEARSDEYWFKQAVAAGDPLAVMDRAFKAATQPESVDSAGSNGQRHAALLSDARVAVEAKEPAGIARVGWLYQQPDVAQDSGFQGSAWLLAACHLGYDCSNKNPEIGNGCVEAGTCSPGLTLLDVMQRDMRADHFGEVYAASQDIVYKIEAGDWEGLQQYLETQL